MKTEMQLIGMLRKLRRAKLYGDNGKQKKARYNLHAMVVKRRTNIIKVKEG